MKLDEICKILSGLKMTLVSMIFLILSAIFAFFKISFMVDFAVFTIIISGVPIIYFGLKNLFLNKKLTASLLISIAMTAAILTNEIFAAAEVAFIMALGGILEDLTIDKAKKGITKLLNLVPKTARKLNINDNSVTEEIVPAETIQKGDIIRILAGEDIPSDGVIISGETSINQAIVTGESIPVDKQKGDSVFSGTTNCYGVIDVEVTKEYKDSTVQKLIKLVKEAENKKAPTQRIVDKWATVLIPSAILFAIIVYLITGEISRAVTVLVVFCPCSFVLATPTSIMAAIGNATKKGIIIKENNFNQFQDDLFLAAESYISAAADDYKVLKSNNQQVCIKIQDLIEGGWIKSTLVDPKENKTLGQLQGAVPRVGQRQVLPSD